MHASLTGQLKDLLNANSPAEWLLAVVAFANDSEENLSAALMLFSQLSDKELVHFADLLERPDFILHINSIFFYKLNTQQLFISLSILKNSPPRRQDSLYCIILLK